MTPNLAPGTILGFVYPPKLSDPMSIAIPLGTLGIPGVTPLHVGIIVPMYGYSTLLVEAMGTVHIPPVLPSPRTSTGIVATDAEDRIRHHIGEHKGKVVVYQPHRFLSHQERDKLADFASSHLGEPFDYRGQYQARILGLSWLAGAFRNGRESLHQWFCAKFVFACLREIGWVDGRASSQSPGRLLSWLTKSGLYVKE